MRDAGLGIGGWSNGGDRARSGGGWSNGIAEQQSSGGDRVRSAGGWSSGVAEVIER